VNVTVRELVAWGLDESSYRPECVARELTARHGVLLARVVSEREYPHDRRDNARADHGAPFRGCQLDPSTLVVEMLAEQAGREDLHAEMAGLEWSTGVVDLRGLIAFQRRLIFDEAFVQEAVPAQADWGALVELAFGRGVTVEYDLVAGDGEWVLTSANPNMQLRAGADAPFEVYGGSPLFEVAEYRGRWFLRDGYHRAYRLLRAGVYCCPAVIVRAKTLKELGPVQPWFFAEEVLFGDRPPCVVDFLSDELTMEYTRPRLLKTLRVRMEESMEEQG
jgi:hypothetical protein